MAVPSGATTFIPESFAWGTPSTASSRFPPRRSRISVVKGLKYSAHGLSRGNRVRSTSTTDNPARASSSAVVAPAGPAPTTPTSQPFLTWLAGGRPGFRSARLAPHEVRAQCRHGRPTHGRRQIHAVVVQPSPAPRQPHRLVTHGGAALKARIARRTFKPALRARSEQRVGEHSGDSGDGDHGQRARGRVPPAEGARQPRNEQRTGHTTERSQGGDTPRRSAGHGATGGDEARREGRECPDLRRPGVGGGGGDAPVGEHLPRHAARPPSLGELREQATGEQQNGKQQQRAPAEPPGDPGPDRASRDQPAAGEPVHSSSSSSRIRRFSSAGAPRARQRTRRKLRNTFSKSKCSPHGGQVARWSRISCSTWGVSSRSRYS